MKRTAETFRQHLEKVVATCGTTWLLLTRPSILGQEYLAIPNTCKSAYCPRCRPAQLRKLRKALFTAMARKTWRLCTLTFPWTPENPLEAFRQASRAWRRFQRKFEHAYPGTLWVRTLEVHQSGRPHFHMVVDRYIPQAHLERLWHEAGGGIVDIRMAHDKTGRRKACGYKQAARYLTEEIEKTVQDPHRMGSELWQSGMRTITYCRAIKLRPQESDWTFYAARQTLDDLRLLLAQQRCYARLYDQPEYSVAALDDDTWIIAPAARNPR